MYRPFDFEISEGNRTWVDSFLAFTIAYFSTDMIFDYDPRFITHHVLCILAVATTLVFPHLEGTFLITAMIAETGGVMYHVSKLVHRDAMTITFLYTYSFTRMVLFPLFLIWLLCGMMLNKKDVTVPNVWATAGTLVLVAINIRWSFTQWARLYPKPSPSAPVSPTKSPPHHHGRNVTVLICPSSPMAKQSRSGPYDAVRRLFSGMAAVAWDVST